MTQLPNDALIYLSGALIFGIPLAYFMIGPRIRGKILETLGFHRHA